MYISEIKMHGFKSFAKKEVMKLGKGVTTVVGPNGCGKTNIVDAIRWVLGEQKSRVLRGGKMEDVIFNGAEGVKPLSVCDVRLTVHNNAGRLPIEYTDVEIGRRVFRNGESEYSINRTSCRLKDIHDLFIDTGMGSDAYSVIELKMIEQILSETGDDRRHMFEEAAGINKYRDQRKATLRKFETIKRDLDRVNDIVIEVEQKVNSLKLQLKRYERHEKYSKQLKKNYIELAFCQVRNIDIHMKPLNKVIKDFKKKKENKTNNNSIHEKELEFLQLSYKSQENAISNLNTNFKVINDKQHVFRQNILIWTEKRKALLITIDRLERELENNKKKAVSVNDQNSHLETELSILERDLNLDLERFKFEKNKFENLEIEYLSTSKELEDFQSDRWIAQRKAANDKSLFERTKTLYEDKKEELKDRIKVHDANLKKKASYDDEIKSLNKDLLKFKKKRDSTLAYSKRLSKNLSEILNNKNENIEKIHLGASKIELAKGQILFYEGLVESKQGFPSGTKYVLENPEFFPDVLGTIADILIVKEAHRDAIEAILGDLSHSLVVKDKEKAFETLEAVVSYGAGDITLIPLKEASQIFSDFSPVPKNNNAIIGRASELVKTSKKMRPLINYILGNVLIVDDLGKVIENSLFSKWGIVDIKGSYSGNDLIFKNRQILQDQSIFGRKDKLNKIFDSIEELIVANKNLELYQKENNENIKKTNDDIKNIDKQISELVDRISDLESQKIEKILNVNILLENEETNSHEIDNLKKIIIDSKSSLELMKPQIKKIDKSLVAFEKKIIDINKDNFIKKTLFNNQQAVIQDQRISIVNIESKIENIKFKIKTSIEEENNLMIRNRHVSQKLEDAQAKGVKNNNDILQVDQELKTIDIEVSKIGLEMIDKQKLFRETYQKINEVQIRIKSEQTDREIILENLKNSELELISHEQNLKSIEDKILDRYDTRIPKDLVVNNSIEELRTNINRLNKSIENIGPINMAVKDEYQQEFERVYQLIEQRDDLIQSEQNLRDTIQKIDRVARKKFLDTFEQIKFNYEKLFNLFFEGGIGSIKLSGDPDPLEANIVIEAQPPGKRNTSLRLLSSGEKALTAISLLFAIYQVKPSPYCILDEVDAPLDDINIKKFTKVLKKFSDDTQFIIVTHNKLTMEIATHMYGVTQEKKGISKLVSVKFD